MRIPSRVLTLGITVGCGHNASNSCTGIFSKLLHSIRGSRPAPYCSEAESTDICGNRSKSSNVIVLSPPTCFKIARVSSL